MSVIKEWQRDRTSAGGRGVVLHTDHLVWYYENRAGPSTEIGAERTLNGGTADARRAGQPALITQ